MKKSKTVLIICGGRSPEHEVTLRSANYVLEHMPLENQVYIWGIDRDNNGYALSTEDVKRNNCVSSSIGAPLAYLRRYQGRVEFCIENGASVEIDIVFPMIHGATGEDGCLQGMSKFLGVPCVGADVMGSALCMQKRITKQVLMANNLPIVPFLFSQNASTVPSYACAVDRLKSENLFIKPAGAGSSIGVSSVCCESEYLEAIQEAFCYDDEILIERKILGKEIECSVLNGTAAKVLGEIEPTHSFYSYEAKYLDPNGACFYTPARISHHQADRVRAMAEQVAHILKCDSMVRVDFFLTQDETLWINEANTLPGLTAISFYPKLLELSGIPGVELIRSLLQGALKNYTRSLTFLTTVPWI
ncbi:MULTISPECIES: D-alanine--D-alanine ligase family protein [Holospora]|uniref:D-alanine--D-alanine ligase n=2 Tax=Holospora TaxID=44747 RepID=A0A061JIG4_9PROT|nr:MULTISPECIES: D-alanine--D-alanine ligase family protein [Holospora]ETZ04834.1 D-alanine--D-alanine ligase [Holospora undulata HU1]GAJ46371.1 D-alanine--D-alanine ligase [Holospora elegans E1]